MQNSLNLTNNDREILEVLWAGGKMDMTAIIANLPDDNKLTRHTVRSCLLRMIDKQLIDVEKLNQRNYYYFTLQTREEFIAAETSAYVHDRYDGMTNMIAGLALGKQISDDELDEIESFIKNYKNQG